MSYAIDVTLHDERVMFASRIFWMESVLGYPSSFLLSVVAPFVLLTFNVSLSLAFQPLSRDDLFGPAILAQNLIDIMRLSCMLSWR